MLSRSYFFQMFFKKNKQWCFCFSYTAVHAHYSSNYVGDKRKCTASFFTRMPSQQKQTRTMKPHTLITVTQHLHTNECWLSNTFSVSLPNQTVSSVLPLSFHILSPCRVQPRFPCTQMVFNLLFALLPWQVKWICIANTNKEVKRR